MKVFVYFNLHKKTYSVKALEREHKNKVILHIDKLILKDCIFKVSEAGRQRVLKEKRKNVHAGVLGYYLNEDDKYDYIEYKYLDISYNPYKLPYFYFKENINKVENCKYCILETIDNKPMVKVSI